MFRKERHTEKMRESEDSSQPLRQGWHILAPNIAYHKISIIPSSFRSLSLPLLG
jgi:hypothetical protein